MIKDSVIIISYLAMILMGGVGVLLSKFLSDKIMSLDERRFFIEDKSEYIKIKRKQLKMLGLYYILIGILFLTIIKSQIIIMILSFLMPGVIIGKMEHKLKQLYKVI
ncbi:hypothetical protein [Clostridium sp. CCUG 7971]|uniref:hypothetical protein n=1 Tax=Clostridium sp. CCUG 7971 TaxID=2811414 RepID=UPI001ABA86B2|nr:hypothetical protein [Clostridium sp. CCUG 7971]MBO3444941.1 hypothetical protein [Clostridium sp. CCUG 7971]